VKYEFIKAHKDIYSVTRMCSLFSVSRSGYYAWINHKPSTRELENINLDNKIASIFSNNKQRYGSPRITRELKKDGHPCSYNRVANRMKALNLKALAKKKFKVTTDSEHSKPVFKNILNRDFTTTQINQKWAGDITYIATNEGWLYLAVIIDLHSRAIIGWSMSKRMTKQLVCDALIMALFNRKFPENVIVHTDRGSQYCSNKYRKIIKNNKLTGSMSRKGNCWDNAISESFFHTLKVELIHQQKYLTRQEAKSNIFQYIEGYYNKKRMHSSIDYKTPYEVECNSEYA
jgi:putative transposase